MVILQSHGLSHRLKEVASHYDVDVLLTVKKKIGAICPAPQKRMCMKET